ncbi:MAG: glycosyltransferase [Agitococcus sp.]
MARYKIVHVMATAGGVVGGLEKHTLELCAALAQQHEVHLLADRPYQGVCHKQIHFHPINFSLSRWNPFLYWQIAQTINHIQPNIVHAQAGKAASIIRWLKWLFRQIKFVATVHGTKKDISAYAAMDGVITVSRQLAEAFGNHPHLKVIYNGARASPKLNGRERKLLRAELLAAEDLPIVMAVGRLAPVKAFDVLLKAFVGLEARLVIVGDGDERESLQQLAEQLGLSNRVLFLGHRQDVGSLLQVADLCVISSHREGFSYVAVESLQAGCLVVSTRVGLPAEWLPPALLTAPNDVEGLHNLLYVTLSRIETLRSNFLPLFLRAQQELTIEGMAERTQAFYSELLEDPHEG